MYRDNYVFTADLVAFVEQQDLPPHLHPFARSASRKDHVRLERNARLAILRIREAPDAWHAVIINDGMTIEEIEAKIERDLEVVRLAEETRDLLEDLLERFQKGEFTVFLRPEVRTA